MPMPFRKWRYIYPPRPGSATPYPISGQEGSDVYRSGGEWQAQLKLNGTRSLIVFRPDGGIEFYNRHAEHHKAWSAPGWMVAEIRKQFRVEKGEWSIIDSELLHSKHASVKDTLYAFDILVLNGRYLVKTSYEERFATLSEVCGHPTTEVAGFDGMVLEIGRGLWMATVIDEPKWDEAWALSEKIVGTAGTVIEGLVFKRMKAMLDFGHSAANNGLWMVRCRRETKALPF